MTESFEQYSLRNTIDELNEYNGNNIWIDVVQNHANMELTERLLSGTVNSFVHADTGQIIKYNYDDSVWGIADVEGVEL